MLAHATHLTPHPCLRDVLVWALRPAKPCTRCAPARCSGGHAERALLYPVGEFNVMKMKTAAAITQQMQQHSPYFLKR
jgi:hypothetical protein